MKTALSHFSVHMQDAFSQVPYKRKLRLFLMSHVLSLQFRQLAWLLSSRVDRYHHRTSMMLAPTREEATADALAMCAGDAAAARRFWTPRGLLGRLLTGRLPTGRLPTGRTGPCCMGDVRTCGGTPASVSPLPSAVSGDVVDSAPNSAAESRVNGGPGVNSAAGAADLAAHGCAADTGSVALVPR